MSCTITSDEQNKQIIALLTEIRDLLRADARTSRGDVLRPLSRKVTGTMDGFDQFWMMYPKKVGRGAAEREWQRIGINPGLFDTIIDAVRIQSRSEKWREDGGKYIPHPSTWLHQKRWMDQIAVNIAQVQPKAMQQVPALPKGEAPPPEVAAKLSRLFGKDMSF